MTGQKINKTVISIIAGDAGDGGDDGAGYHGDDGDDYESKGTTPTFPLYSAPLGPTQKLKCTRLSLSSRSMPALASETLGAPATVAGTRHAAACALTYKYV